MNSNEPANQSDDLPTDSIYLPQEPDQQEADESTASVAQSRRTPRWLAPVAGILVGAVIAGAGVGLFAEMKMRDWAAHAESVEAGHRKHAQGLSGERDKAVAQLANAESKLETARGSITTLTSERSTMKSELAVLERSAEEASEGLRVLAEELEAREVEVEAREVEVAEREAAISAAEQQVADSSISEGTWTVGRDIEPGTYVTSEGVSDYCYWAILRSGTNGSDIIENDIVTGGRPTVTLSSGQDFTTRGCGRWIRDN